MDLPSSVLQLFQFGIAAVGGIMTVHLIRLVFPYRRPKGISDAELDALSKQLKDGAGLLIAAALLAGAVAAAALFVIFYCAAALHDTSMPAHEALFRGVAGEPSYHIWVPPAVVLAALWTFWFHNTLYQLCYGRSIARARHAVGGRETGVNKRKFWLVATAVGLPACLVYVLLALDWYVRVEPDRIVVNDFWTFGEREYPYTDVRALVQTSHTREPGDEDEPDPQLHVLFADGRRWTATATDETGRAVRYIVWKTGLPLESAHVIEDVPRP